MLGIVLPVVVPVPVYVVDVVAIDVVDVCLVVVAYVIVVYINVDVAVPPTTVVAPAASVVGTDGKPDSESNRNSSSVITGWRVVNWRVGVDGRSVHHDGIIRRYINDLRIGLLNYYDRLGFHRLRFHGLLLCGF